MDPIFKSSDGNLAAEPDCVMEIRFFSPWTARFQKNAAILLFPAVTLLLVATTLHGGLFNTPLMVALLIVGVVLLGLPHGALDPLVARQRFAGQPRFTMTRFLLAYLGIAVLCAAGWLAIPNLGLILFLIISAFHFGSDWQDRGSSWGRTAYGACIISVSTLHHSQAVRQIYLQLGATGADAIISASKVVAVLAAVFALLSLLPQMRERWRDGLELGVIVIGGLVLQPLIFFICYFCLLHSPRHLASTAREVGVRGLSATVKAVAPAVCATLILAALLWRFLPASQNVSLILQIVFIGLAALTVPHMILTETRRYLPSQN